MEQLEVLQQWLRSFPGWGGTAARIDHLPAAPDSNGLFPLGLEVLERRCDLLGQVRLRCRQKFALDRAVCPGQEQAAWLLEFQRWVAEQSALGLAPRFGDDPAAEHIRAEKGRLKEVSAAGTAVYEVILTAEFVRKFEE